MSGKGANEHGTGSAVTFITTDLGTGKMLVVADKIQQQHAGGHIGMDGVIIEDKCDQGLWC